MFSSLLSARVVSCVLTGLALGVAVSSPVVAQSQSQTHGYDALGRRVSVVRSDGTSSTYAYDRAGNRSQVVVVGQSLTPGAFDLGGPVNAAAGAWATSNVVTVTGVNAPVAVSVTGGQYRISAGAWTAASGTVSVGGVSATFDAYTSYCSGSNCPVEP
jgi:YD repeat-containing protein